MNAGSVTALRMCSAPVEVGYTPLMAFRLAELSARCSGQPRCPTPSGRIPALTVPGDARRGHRAYIQKRLPSPAACPHAAARAGRPTICECTHPHPAGMVFSCVRFRPKSMLPTREHYRNQAALQSSAAEYIRQTSQALGFRETWLPAARRAAGPGVCARAAAGADVHRFPGLGG
jgi:hypothetical protein